MFAGHDTTTSGEFWTQIRESWLTNYDSVFQSFQKSLTALSFALSFITEHKEVKAKCLEEIQSVCLSNGQLDLSTENLRKLTYLEACIKETLRLRTRLDKVDSVNVPPSLA